MKTYQLLLIRHLAACNSALEIKFEYSGTDISTDVKEFVAQQYPEWRLQEVAGLDYGYLHHPLIKRRFKSKFF